MPHFSRRNFMLTGGARGICWALRIRNLFLGGVLREIIIGTDYSLPDLLRTGYRKLMTAREGHQDLITPKRCTTMYEIVNKNLVRDVYSVQGLARGFRAVLDRGFFTKTSSHCPPRLAALRENSASQQQVRPSDSSPFEAAEQLAATSCSVNRVLAYRLLQVASRMLVAANARGRRPTQAAQLASCD
jgi:hypothetical protein